MKKTTFLCSDAWLLAAMFWIHREHKAATLAHIIEYGDGLNHGIFNLDELQSGLARLTAAGLVREEGKEFLPQAQAAEWFKEFRTLSLSTVGSMDWLAKKLGAERYRPGRDPRNNLSYPSVTRDRFEEAVTAWHLKTQQLLRSLKV